MYVPPLLMEIFILNITRHQSFSEHIEKIYPDLDNTSSISTSHSELRDQVSKIFADLTDHKDRSLDLDKSQFELGV